MNIADPERSGRDYEDRLLKYVKRGFTVAVLGIMTSRIKCKYLGNNEFFTFVHGKKLRHVVLDFSQTRRDGKPGPVCTIQKEEIQGLAKLLVLSSLHDGKNRLIRAGKLLAWCADWSYNDFLLDPTPPISIAVHLLHGIKTDSGDGPLVPFGTRLNSPEEVLISMLRKISGIRNNSI